VALKVTILGAVLSFVVTEICGCRLYVTDEERQKYDVPPLAESRKYVETMNQRQP
jgi:hypothetical protein